MSHVSRRAFIGSVPAAAAAAQVVTPTINEANLKKPEGKIRIFAMSDFTPDEVRQIESAVPGRVEVTVGQRGQDYRPHLREADVVFGILRANDLDYAPRLKWMQWPGAGMEGLDPGLKSTPLVITNMARIFAPGISETAMGLLLCLTRGITTYYMPQFYKHQMNPVGSPRSADHIELAGKTMAIVGMGGIGSNIARRAAYGFDMRIIATDARPMAKPEYVAELHDPGWFEAMVPRADVLVAAAPQTTRTEGMFNEKIFRAMKPTAYFLGMSRGKLFDDMALVKALKQKWIAGAGLDVFPVEPPPPEHPIYECTNVVMTAHTSGWSPDRQRRLVDLFAENVRRYANGLPLMNVVDKAAGY